MDAPKAPASASPRPLPGASPDAPDARTRRRTRFIGAGLLVALALWMARSYLASLGWAVIIALSVWPLYRRIEHHRRDAPILTPLLVTGLLAVVLLVPVAMVLVEFGREAQSIVTWMENAQQHGIPVPDWAQRLPLLGHVLDVWWRTHLSAPQAAGALFGSLDAGTVTGWSKTLGSALATRLLHAFITFMALFMLLRHGERIGVHVLEVTDRWLGRPGEKLAEKMAAAVRGTVNGTLLVAIGEGLLIGAGFVVAGVPHAVLFAILTTAFAMLPLGAWFAFGTAALVHVLSGGTILAAAAVLGWGAAVMLVGDNIVQPALIGGSVRLPFLWTLVGILGGLETFGLIGLFLGPVIMAALLTVWRSQVAVAPEAIDRPPPSVVP